jgi:SAM-dependent methyltransferase
MGPWDLRWTTTNGPAATDVLTEVVRNFPLPENPSESRYLGREVPRCLDVCGLVTSQCPKDGRLLSVECEPGYTEVLLRRHHGFESIVGLCGRPSPGLSLRLATFGIPMLECRVDRDLIPKADGVFAAVLLSRVPEHLREGLPHALTEFKRVLASGGILVVGTSNVTEFRNRITLRRSTRTDWSRDRSGMMAAKVPRPDRHSEHTEREMARLLGEAGFLIDKVHFPTDAPRLLARLASVLRPRAGWAIYFTARRP